MFFSLVFRQSSCQHPLLAKAIALIARKKRANCEAICNTEGAYSSSWRWCSAPTCSS